MVFWAVIWHCLLRKSPGTAGRTAQDLDLIIVANVDA